MVSELPCPNCGQPTDLSPDNRWRPFCCQRCKLIDLGEWFAEEHRIPADEQDDDLSDPSIGDDDPPPH
ncbi:DNA gyrase inhibitor YacG [Salinisphaera sp. P385]|uniref:DNA gyrase inhibitor YacG n=1 Tax=Spectribacter acetivorans TaxID=3075603 RepID=A0ABU3B6J1_9GAMM|nr:DNA gyrase inhibitor YacG [Salinisphaera sp. P385]MDT0618067.1 DNA gyrase inhibitor YacG [Salinisphaera sp. P385]